jgi:hypothetical protein
LEPDDITVMDDIRMGKIKEFTGTLVDFSVVDPLTDSAMTTHPLLWLLSFLGEWDPFTKYTNSQIIDGEINQFQISLFAYQALIFGTVFHSDISRGSVDWRDLLRNQAFIFKFKELRDLITEGQNKGMGFEYSPIRYYPSIKSPCMEDY